MRVCVNGETGFIGRQHVCDVKRRQSFDLAAVICPLKTGSLLARVFGAVFPRLGRSRADEGLEVFGGTEGVHFEARG
jgi:hypothetical protein